MTSRTQRATGSGPINRPPTPSRGRARLKALLFVGLVVALAGGALLLARSSDMDDDAQTQSAAGVPAPAPAPGAQAKRRSNGPPKPASSGGKQGAPATPQNSASGVPAAIPGGAPDARAAAAATVVPAREKARDAGTAPVAEARRTATPPPAAAPGKSKSGGADGGAAAVPGQRQAQAAPASDTPSRRDGASRRDRDDDDGTAQIRVARFMETGGVNLEGRIINIDTGRPVAGLAVEVRLAEKYVEVETDADGAFKAVGMVPGSKVMVWMGGRRDRMVAERFDVRIPDSGKKADLGMIRLLAADELDSHLDGWIGVYVARKDDKVRISAVNAWAPANRAGIEVGDAVLSVDGRDVKGMGARSVGFLLRGPSGSSITLEVESTEKKRRQLTLKRVVR